MWDCVAFDEVAGIHFKDKDGIQIMKNYMASGSFARGKEEKAASASMVFVGNINQSVDVLLKTSSLFDPFPPEMGMDTAFLDRMHCYVPGWEIPKFRPEHFTDDYGFITDYLAEFIRELRKEQYGDAFDQYYRLGKNLNQRDTIAVRKMVGGLVKLIYPDIQMGFIQNRNWRRFCSLRWKVEDSDVTVNVIIKDETIWLSQKGMAELCGCSSDNISHHLKDFFQKGNCKKIQLPRNSRQLQKTATDAIISVGYRVNSKGATSFRIWATKELKE